MKVTFILIALALINISCTKSNDLSNLEKMKIMDFLVTNKMSNATIDAPENACITSFVSYNDYKVTGDSSSITLVYKPVAILMISLTGGKVLAQKDQCDKLRQEVKKLKGKDAADESVEITWNNKTGKRTSINKKK